MIIPLLAFQIIVVVGIVGSAALMLTILGYFIYELRKKQIW